MANQIQQFVATNATSPVVVRCYRAGFVAEDVTLNTTMTAAQIVTAFQALTMFTAVSASAGFGSGNGTANLTFSNPGNERLWFDLVAPSNGWATTTTTMGTSLADALGKPLVDQITYNSARLSAPVGGKPAGVNSANLRLRSKEPGALDSAFSPWTPVITGIPWTGNANFVVPENKIVETDFEII